MVHLAELHASQSSKTFYWVSTGCRCSKLALICVDILLNGWVMLATLRESEVESCRHGYESDMTQLVIPIWAPRYVTSVTPDILLIRVAVQHQGYSTGTTDISWNSMKHVSVCRLLYSIARQLVPLRVQRNNETGTSVIQYGLRRFLYSGMWRRVVRFVVTIGAEVPAEKVK